MNGICRICGQLGEGQSFDAWVRDTFTNWDLLHPGEIICSGCLFWFEQHSTELQSRMGKDKPQKMQNYSQFIVAGAWEPVSKGDKPRMRELLLAQPFPELAAIAVSGQKHLAFRARRNPAGQTSGWVQFEEQAVWVDPGELWALLVTIEALYVTFSKGEIETGRYFPARILAYGLARWQADEAVIQPLRKTALFGLALFLAQRKEQEDGDDGQDADGAGGDAPGDHLAGHPAHLQEPLPDDHLGAVRERDPRRGLHQQPGDVSQPSLWSFGSGDWADGGGAERGGDAAQDPG